MSGDQLTEKQAREIFERKIVYVEDIDWTGITIVVNGVTYTIDVNWKSEGFN